MSSLFSNSVHYCRRSRAPRRFLGLLVALLLLLLYCEWALYYFTLLRCTWPQLPNWSKQQDPYVALNVASDQRAVKIMVLADTHLLGWRRGHWFDKLRREWQMQRSFQAAMFVHAPDVVFVLGDLLDEGKWAQEEEFEVHVRRFRRMFRVPATTQLHVLAGNHDIGFHYDMTRHKVRRFAESFDASASVRLLHIHGINFVLINSVAFEGDACFLCADAQTQLLEVSRQLSQANTAAVAPVLLTHYPLFRSGEADCPLADDAAPLDSRDRLPNAYQPRYDCLSEQASHQLLRLLRPRLVLSGHTHWSCVRNHSLPEAAATAVTKNVTEITMPSFSWRYLNAPSFLLLKMGASSAEWASTKCALPYENFVIQTYSVIGSMLCVWFVWPSVRDLFACVVGHRASTKRH